MSGRTAEPADVRIKTTWAEVDNRGVKSVPWTRGNRLIGYDPVKRRIWVAGQRMHHGTTGLLLALTGTILMLHDWKDHSIWFERGPGRQP